MNNPQIQRNILKKTGDFDIALTELERISTRTLHSNQSETIGIVEKIISDVKESGDQALIKYTNEFDGFSPVPLAVNTDEIQKAWEESSEELKKALCLAKERIESFHQLQFPKDIMIEGEYGEKLGRIWNPVEKAGIYVPGGRASYPSTVLMNAIPALVAGVKEIVMTSPAGKNGSINKTVLAAANLCGVSKIFRIGGAQAISALAFGTESIPKVDIISAPGNIYVTLAKKLVYGDVGIDSLAGPSEILIIADEAASAEQVASDLLAQAEHDPLAAAILLTTNAKLIEEVQTHLINQLENHPRREICINSISQWGLSALCKDIESCIKLANYFAPEHLEIIVKDPENYIQDIKNAGAIFIGPWSPEAAGDYLAGPNHTLPTCKASRFSGALSVETFMKNTSIINFNQKSLEITGKDIIELAKSEGLYSHGKSIEIRLSKT